MSELLIERSPESWVFTLNRPNSGNSLSPALVAAFHQGLDNFEKAGVRVLLIQGTGRHFCTGFDLSDIADVTDAELLHRFVRIEQVLARLWAAPYTTIAVAKGRVMGAGADLFAACSRRIAVDNSSFAFPGAAFGLVLGTRRLSRRIGESAALHLITTGTVMDAPTALASGLATSHVEDGKLPSVLDTEIAAALRLDAITVRAVRHAASAETRELDWDLAALVRSAARPGLRERIIAYRAEVLGASAARTSS